MKSAKDHFSKQSNAYKKYRPTYPEALYQELLKWTGQRDSCWDCGTGNGQVALALSPYFQSVYATDISQKQIQNAGKRANVIFSVGRAEKTGFEDNRFDLITVAQAIHWFDLKAFQKEVRRVSKNGGILAFWGYGLLRVSPAIDGLLDEFYVNRIGPYWDTERRHIDAAYQTIELDLKQIPIRNDFALTVSWSLERLQGYLNTWSSVQNYKSVHNGENPVEELMVKLNRIWPKTQVKTVKFPVFMQARRLEK